MLLAAGFGKRMVPVTLTRAKPTLPYLNRPLLLRQIDYLRAAGISDVVVNLHHQPQSIRSLLATESRAGTTPATDTFDLDGVMIHLSPEAERLGTSGGLHGAAAQLRGDGTLLCLNSDMICGIDLDAMGAAHRRLGRAATLVLVPWREGCGYTPVQHDGSSLLGFGETMAGGHHPPGIFTGIHLLEEEILDRLPPGPSEFLPDLYLPMLAEGVPPAVVVSPDRWVELGTPDRYLAGQMSALEESPLRGRGCRLSDGAVLGPGTVLGDEVEIGAGVEVTTSILMDGVRVGNGGHLREVIAGPRTRIPGDCEVQRAVLAPAILPAPAGGFPAGVRAWEGLLRADF
ncbi:MAG: NDP-sugar synthase [Acidobacteria bacterium]|nr:NDP-sugar synthase [Acidobacteriota bacterium]MCZ6833619.1 NDP-sugar synthase [Acidobacteriota bacterium]